jgi:hypothetical protein
MHDAVALESKGVSSCAVFSDAFERQAAFQAEKLGLTAAPRAFVAHPISDQTREQLVSKATAVFEDVVHALTGPDFENQAASAVSGDAFDDEDEAGPDPETGS